MVFAQLKIIDKTQTSVRIWSRVTLSLDGFNVLPATSVLAIQDCVYVNILSLESGFDSVRLSSEHIYVIVFYVLYLQHTFRTNFQFLVTLEFSNS